MSSQTVHFVLIPGAWHTGATWLPVARRLRQAGAVVDIIEIPGQRALDNERPDQVHLVDAVQALVDHVERRDQHDVVLVGHSLGGYVIGGALARIHDRVRKVLYYGAHIPVPDVCMADAFPDRMAPLRAASEASPDGSVAVPDPELLAAAFVPGASADFQGLVADLLVPVPGAYFLEPVEQPTRPTDHGIEAHFVLGQDDLILPPPATEFPAMVGLEPQFVPGGHESLLTHPDPLAKTLLRLAEIS